FQLVGGWNASRHAKAGFQNDNGSGHAICETNQPDCVGNTVLRTHVLEVVGYEMNGAIGRKGQERRWKRRRTLRSAGLRRVRHRLRRRHHRPTGAVDVLVEADLVDRDWPETDRREQSGARLKMVVALRGIDEAGVLLLSEDAVLDQIQSGVAPCRHWAATLEDIAPDVVDAGLEKHGGHLRIALEIQFIDV